MSESSTSGRYYLRLELLAIESSPEGVIDPDRDVPFAVLTETTMTLHHLAERYLHTDS